MLHRDYILRLVEQFAKRLGDVLARKKAGDLDGATGALAETSRQLLGLDVDTLLAFPPEQLLGLFRSGGTVDIGKCLVAGDVLREHGDLAELSGDETRAVGARWLALNLYLEVLGSGEPDRVPERSGYEARAESLLELFAGYDLPTSVGANLIGFREAQGRYADAEDILFLLLDRGADELVGVGAEFYQRLLAKSDHALQEGGLPREEVQEGLAALNARRQES